MSNLVFKSLRGSLDLAFGDLHFYVNNLGVLRLPNQIHPTATDSTKPPATITISSTSSVGSSDEPESASTSIYCSDCDAHHAITESGVIFEHDSNNFFNDIDNFDRNPRPTHLLCAAIDPLTGAEETDERRTERENIEKANADALRARVNASVLVIPEASWAKARAAVRDNTAMPDDSTREDLLAYNRLLR